MKNREIKFRAWDKIDLFMYPSSGITNTGEACDWMGDGQSEDDVEIEPTWILMQFTGLKDINKKDIYEGDIINFWCGNLECTAKHFASIVWLDELGCWGFKENGQKNLLQQPGKDGYIGLIQKIEVLGNIYENPKLLK